MFEEENDFCDYMSALDVQEVTHNLIVEEELAYDKKELARILNAVQPCLNFDGVEHISITNLFKAYRSVDIEMLMLGTPFMSSNAVQAFGRKWWLRTSVKLPLAISKVLHGEDEDAEA